SFVTPEDKSALRALERFIGRGIVRKRSDGCNYAAVAAVKSARGAKTAARLSASCPSQAGSATSGRRRFAKAPWLPLRLGSAWKALAALLTFALPGPGTLWARAQPPHLTY